MKLRFKVSLITAVTLLAGSVVSGAVIIYHSALYNREQTVENYEQQIKATAYAVGKELEYEPLEHFKESTAASYYDYVIRKYGWTNYILIEESRVVCNKTPFEPADPSDMRWSDQTVIQKSEDRYLLVIGRSVPAAVSRDYKLLLVQDISSVYEDIHSQISLYLVICMWVAAGAGFLVFAAVGRILSPLRELQCAAQDISGGRLDRRAGVRSRDEIGALARSFNDMADRIERQVEEISRESEQRRQMLGSLTHEMKTPMTSIMGYADSLLHVNLKEKQKERALQHIYEECGRLGRLGSKLLNLMGMYDNDSIHMEETSVRDLFESVARAEESHLRQKNMTLQVFCQMETRQMDRDLFESLLINLIDNGIKASKEGSSIEMAAEENRIMVKDWGCGIPEDEIPKVTEAFYMVDKSRSRREGGSGLGLALCDKIAQLHGAELRIESMPGNGTVVSVVFE